jgi:hypothetical protein
MLEKRRCGIPKPPQYLLTQRHGDQGERIDLSGRNRIHSVVNVFVFSVALCEFFLEVFCHSSCAILPPTPPDRSTFLEIACFASDTWFIEKESQ